MDNDSSTQEPDNRMKNAAMPSYIPRGSWPTMLDIHVQYRTPSSFIVGMPAEAFLGPPSIDPAFVRCLFVHSCKGENAIVSLLGGYADTIHIHLPLSSSQR